MLDFDIWSSQNFSVAYECYNCRRIGQNNYSRSKITKHFRYRRYRCTNLNLNLRPIVYKHVSWNPPTKHFFKLNFDGSVKRSSAAAGVIIRDGKGIPRAVKAFHLGKGNNKSTLVAEATALRNGVCLARDLRIKRLIIEGDNLTVINVLRGFCKCPREIKLLYRDICLMLGEFEDFKICHVFREGNRAADWVAKKGMYYV